MNIFIIPSWYPTPVNPIAGIFVKEQALAMAELNHDMNIIVSKWDNGYSSLPIKKPYLIPQILTKYFIARGTIEQVGANFYELYTPALTWSRKLPTGGHLQLFKAIRKSLLIAIEKFKKIDVIHAHVSYPAGIIAYMLSKEFNIPYVITEHMGPFPFHDLTNLGKPIKEIFIAFKNASRTIAVSHSLATTIQSYNLPCSNIVPNYIDEHLFTPCTNKKEKFTFFTLCGISEQKGIDILLHAISKIDKSLNEKIDFLIAGEGKELQKYQQLSIQLGLSNVTWLGRITREDTPSYFQRSHAFVLPSRHETFGIVYAEAIACGLPVIATKCGGPEDIVNDFNGLLIDIDNIEQLTHAISSIYTDYKNFDSAKIQKDFQTRFSKKIVVDKMVKIYKEIA